jgi:sulfur relay (sulfurtransferase) complex TusBCD TusD component (DsrE family)
MSLSLERNSSSTPRDTVFFQLLSVITIFLDPLSITTLRVVNNSVLLNLEKWAEIEYKGNEEIHACASFHKRRGIQLGFNWSRAMICQRQRHMVRILGLGACALFESIHCEAHANG